MLGIGAVVAPIGASGLFEPKVTLLEPVKIEVVPELPRDEHLAAMEQLSKGDSMDMQVLLHCGDGTVMRFEGKTIVLDWSCGPTVEGAWGQAFGIPVATSQRTVSWRLNGVMIGNSTLSAC